MFTWLNVQQNKINVHALVSIINADWVSLIEKEVISLD